MNIRQPVDVFSFYGSTQLTERSTVRCTTPTKRKTQNKNSRQDAYNDAMSKEKDSQVF